MIVMIVELYCVYDIIIRVTNRPKWMKHCHFLYESDKCFHYQFISQFSGQYILICTSAINDNCIIFILFQYVIFFPGFRLGHGYRLYRGPTVSSRHRPCVWEVGVFVCEHNQPQRNGSTPIVTATIYTLVILILRGRYS